MQPSEQVKIRNHPRVARMPGVSGGSGRAVALACFLMLLSVVVAGFARAAAPGGWDDVPVRKWAWDEVRSLSQGQQIIDRELHRQGEYNRRWRQVHDLVGEKHISRLSGERLHDRGLGSALLKADGDRRDIAKALVPDVLRVLIVRVSFEANRDSHLTTISPGGDFMLDPLVDPGPLEIDPPPHNKAYFEAHLAGLTEYYRFMSGGRLEIQGTVLPAGDNDSYKLSDVADYGPGAGSFWTIESLEKMVQDMITTSDQGLIDDGFGNGLADYDDETPFTYVIFVHSGSDWQSDINGDSPNDIPTFFVTLGEAVDLIGTNPQGNPGSLSECSVIPETTNQDGFPGSIAAAFYHEFGHALGLPDVYDTQTGLPSVGIWDLMDSGTNLPVTLGTITDEGDTVVAVATGLLPPSLSVWCKWFLGWVEMGEVSDPVSSTGDYLLPAVGVPREQYGLYKRGGAGDFNLDYPQAYRAGTSPREYFLIENRWVPESVAVTPFTDLKFERDEATGVVQYLAGLLPRDPFGGGGWVNSGLYDFFMPPGGLLVWHVNADRISSELPRNTINAYGDGLRLVEADGIQDIGVLDAYVQGWFGSWRDPFGGNDLYGNPTGYTDLHTGQFPNSRNFDRSQSGVRLSEMGPLVVQTASVMRFRATLAPVRDGFPWETVPIDSVEAAAGGGSAGPRVIQPASLTPLTVDGRQVLVFADEPGPDWDGDSFISSFYGVWPDGRGPWVAAPDRPAEVFQTVNGPLAGSPLALEHPTDGSDLIWSTRIGTIGASRLPDVGMPTVLWANDVADSLVSGPLGLNWQGTGTRILVAAYPDSLYLLDRDGNILGPGLQLIAASGGSVTQMKVSVLPFADQGTDLVAVATDTGWFVVQQHAAGLAPAPVFVPYDRFTAHGPEWTAVVPSADGKNRLSIFAREGEISAWEVSGSGELTILPVLPQLDGPLVCAPAVADVDGDGRHDVVMATATRIYGFKDGGIPLRGFPLRFYDLFPLADSTRVQGPLVVADGTGDGVNDIFFNTTGGHLIGLGPTGRLLDGLPLRWGDAAQAGLAVGGEGIDRTLWLVSSGGYTTGFRERITVNGRVSAYAVATTGQRTSEWLGPAGGPARSGPTGLPRDLGSNAPVSVEKEQVYLYPNPLSGDEVKIRFYSQGSSDARLALYNLEGELVADQQVPVNAGAINEIVMVLPDIASGLYMARLEFEGTGGRTIRTMTLAVEK